MKKEVCEDISSAELCNVCKIDCRNHVCVCLCLCTAVFLYNESVHGILGVACSISTHVFTHTVLWSQAE